MLMKYAVVLRRCASQTESSKRKYFAIKEENARVVCYALDYSQLPSLTRDKCFDLSQGAGIHVGTGAHAGIYEVSRK